MTRYPSKSGEYGPSAIRANHCEPCKKMPLKFNELALDLFMVKVALTFCVPIPA